MRHKLLEEIVIFVQAAQQIPGITRIALIGSLTTDKIDPNDVDMLVTVTDSIDLTRLATQGRKLSGHAQNIGRGGEVFLADARNNYLGRASAPGDSVGRESDYLVMRCIAGDGRISTTT